jgi:hypothetical protein
MRYLVLIFKSLSSVRVCHVLRVEVFEAEGTPSGPIFLRNKLPF